MIHTEQQACEALQRVTVKNPPFPIHLAIRNRFGINYLNAIIKVKDRDGGHPIEVNFNFDIPTPISLSLFYDYIESRVQAVFLHEFYECFHVSGVRVKDPHPYGGSDISANFDMLPPLERLSHET